MKARRLIWQVVLCVGSFGLGYVTSDFLEGIHPHEVVLSQPLQISSGHDGADDERSYFLPSGTTLVYEDEQLSKEGDLYRVYVRVFGAPMNLRESELSWPKAPLTSWRIEDAPVID